MMNNKNQRDKCKMKWKLWLYRGHYLTRVQPPKTRTLLLSIRLPCSVLIFRTVVAKVLLLLHDGMVLLATGLGLQGSLYSLHLIFVPLNTKPYSLNPNS